MAVQSICLKSIVVEMVEKVIKIKDVLLKKDVLNVYKCMRGPLSVTFNENYIHAAFRQGNCAEDIKWNQYEIQHVLSLHNKWRFSFGVSSVNPSVNP